MTYESFLIADMKTGLELDKKPFLIPDDAFEELTNIYLWRSRAKRKQGAELLGRLRRNFTNSSIGNTGASPWTFNLISLLSITEPQAQIAPGSVVITIAGPIVFTDQGNGTLTSATPGNSGTINYQTGSVTLIHTAGAGVATTVTLGYYPGLPAMGIQSLELTAINAERTLAFDQTYAYRYNNTSGQFEETPSTMVARWHGNDANLFWGENAQGAIFVTNGTASFQGYQNTLIAIVDGTHFAVTTSVANAFQVNDYVFFYQVTGGTNNQLINGITGQVTVAGNPFTVSVPSTAGFVFGSGGVSIAQNRTISTTGDGIRWYDMGETTWSNFQPPINATSFLIGGLFIFYFRDRLVVFSPTETTSPGGIGSTTHYQRARWSQNGTVYYASNPIPSGLTSQSDAWLDDTPGKGGFLDAPTSERIISGSLIKDNLIVFFERSTWRFRYSGNEELPFIWERINAEFGSDGTFATINFDIGPMTIGSRGIIQTDSINVLRIDSKIPDEAFSFNNLMSGPQRIWGIRDFDEQVVYWCFPNDTENSTFPNRVLLYNYREPSWAFFRDSYTCFGYWQSFNDLTWGGANFTWGSANFTWGSAQSQALYPKVIGGNQQGYVMILQQIASNQQSLRIEAITPGTPVTLTSTNHNLTNVDYIIPVDIIGNGSSLNGTVYKVQVVDANNFNLFSFNSVTQEFDTPVTVGAGTYGGAGEIQRVDNFIIKTKKFNPSLKEGASTRIGWLDTYTDVTKDGAFIVNIYADGNENDPVNLPDDLNPSSNVIETFLNDFETKSQSTVWHTLYNSTVGNFFQIEFTLSPAQLNNIDIQASDFVLHAINIWAESSSQRLS